MDGRGFHLWRDWIRSGGDVDVFYLCIYCWLIFCCMVDDSPLVVLGLSVLVFVFLGVLYSFVSQLNDDMESIQKDL